MSARIRAARGPTWFLDVLVIVMTTIAVVEAPAVCSAKAAEAMAPFFATVAQVSVTLLVAVALFSGALGSIVEYRVRRWLSVRTFVFLGAATVGGVAGCISSLDSSVYPVLFALCVGPGTGGLLTVLIMGWENMRQRRERGALARAAVLDSSAPSSGSPEPADRDGE